MIERNGPRILVTSTWDNTKQERFTLSASMPALTIRLTDSTRKVGRDREQTLALPGILALRDLLNAHFPPAPPAPEAK